jgi:exosome complex component RRP42
MAVGQNIIFDPSKEELAVAEAVLAVSCVALRSKTAEAVRLLSMRTIDPPSRLTPPGIPNSLNSATGGTAPVSSTDAMAQREAMSLLGVWTPPRGGIKRNLVGRVLKMVVEKGGVAEEVLEALEKVEVGS